MDALTSVIDYLDAVEANAASLRRLLAAFHVENSPLLAQPKSAGGQSGSPILDTIRGRIAAIVYLRACIDGGKTRPAADWVAGKLPRRLHRALSPKGDVKGRTIYSWYERWGGEHGEKGPGRDGYLRMLSAGMLNVQIRGDAVSGLPPENTLKRLLAILADSPGVPQSK